MISNPTVDIIVKESDSKLAFKQFLSGDLDICLTDRPLTLSEEARSKSAGVSYISLIVAYEAVCVVVSKKNKFAKSISRDELRRVWAPSSGAKRWHQVRFTFPNRPLVTLGPRRDSPMTRFFADSIGSSTTGICNPTIESDSEDLLVSALTNDMNALGLLPLTDVDENADKVKALAVRFKGRSVTPSIKSVYMSTYPLSRPLYINVRLTSLRRDEVRQLARAFFQRDGVDTLNSCRLVTLEEEALDGSLSLLDQARTGKLPVPSVP